MRVFGLLLLLAGMSLGILWPWAQVNFLGDRGQSVTFGELKGHAPEQRQLFLTRDQNPVRIRFQAAYKVGAKLPPQKIPVNVEITDSDGILLTGTISFSTQGIGTGPEQPKVKASTPLNFKVLNDGPHDIYLTLASNVNDGGIKVSGIDKITATIVANAPVIRDDFKALSAAMALAGFYLIVRSRGRRRKGNTKKTRENPRQWGRGEE